MLYKGHVSKQLLGLPFLLKLFCNPSSSNMQNCQGDHWVVLRCEYGTIISSVASLLQYTVFLLRQVVRLYMVNIPQPIWVCIVVRSVSLIVYDGRCCLMLACLPACRGLGACMDTSLQTIACEQAICDQVKCHCF